MRLVRWVDSWGRGLGMLVLLIGVPIAVFALAIHFYDRNAFTRWFGNQVGITTLTVTQPTSSALQDVAALRAVADKWTYTNATIDLINRASSKSVGYSKGRDLLLVHLPLVLRQAVTKQPKFDSDLSAVPTHSVAGGLLKTIDRSLLQSEATIASGALTRFEARPDKPWAAAVYFGDHMDGVRSRYVRELATFMGKLPANERSQIQAAVAANG